jgi:hypothetical protein
LPLEVSTSFPSTIIYKLMLGSEVETKFFQEQAHPFHVVEDLFSVSSEILKKFQTEFPALLVKRGEIKTQKISALLVKRGVQRTN